MEWGPAPSLPPCAVALGPGLSWNGRNPSRSHTGHGVLAVGASGISLLGIPGCQAPLRVASKTGWWSEGRGEASRVINLTMPRAPSRVKHSTSPGCLLLWPISISYLKEIPSGLRNGESLERTIFLFTWMFLNCGILRIALSVVICSRTHMLWPSLILSQFSIKVTVLGRPQPTPYQRFFRRSCYGQGMSGSLDLAFQWVLSKLHSQPLT